MLSIDVIEEAVTLVGLFIKGDTPNADIKL